MSTPGRLTRRLGFGDAVVIGLGSMIGAGVFAAFGPAAGAAGSGLLLGLALAAVVAYCNATSSARLAARHPESGGTYVYGRERLGAFWGFLAGWSFVVGKLASCAAMALTFAAYAAPGHPRVVAVAAVVVLTAVNYVGVHKSAWLTRVLVVVTLICLGVVVVACLAGGTATVAHLRPFPGSSVRGILESAGLLFFAFAGYARIATLGEEVREPRRTIPRAITAALTITLGVYTAVALASLLAVGPQVLAASAAPLRAAVEAGSLHGTAWVVRIGATVAALGSLMALILGVSRTTLAMARDGRLPRALASIHPRFDVPNRAELAVGAVVIVLVATVDLRGAIGFSSFGVLLYYAIANASATRLRADENPPPRWLPPLGLAGCVLLAVSLPGAAVVGGLLVAAIGCGWWLVVSRAAAPGR
jgi:basic amino acid/polyamine antiporter, APA family